MEESTKPDQPITEGDDNSSASGQVMDIQTSKPSDTAPTLPGSPAPASVGTEPAAASTVSENAPQDASLESAENVQGGAESTPATPPAEPAAGDKPDEPADPAHNPLAIPAEAAHKSGAPVVAIVVAVVVALALAGLVVFTFLKSKKTSVGSTNTPASQTASKPLASPADIDTTDKEIDDSLNKLDESKDFAATDLSDKSLGL